MNRCMTLVSRILALLTLGASSCSALADEKDDKIVGTWKLVSGVSQEVATGQITNIYKGTPVGFISFGPEGRFSVLVVDSNRKKPLGAIPTASEAEALYRSMSAYAGTYTIKGDQVVNHPDASWNETWTGTDQVRHYKLDGDRLSLMTDQSPDLFSGKMSVRTLVWQKVK